MILAPAALPAALSSRLLAGCLAALAVSGTLAGCSGRTPAASHPAPTTPPATTPSTATSATAAPATSRPPHPPPAPTVTLPSPPPLPVPGRIPPLVSPSLPGEGTWQAAAGGRLAGGYAIYTTELRPAPGFPATGIAWIDSAAARVALYAGTSEPYGTWPQQGAVGVAQLPALLAAFNAGFKIYAYQTGWYDQGRSAVPLRPGAASLVIFVNGTATVADWGRDVTLGPNVAAVRQNLTLLVDHGTAAPNVGAPSQWGAVLGRGVSTWRSGAGVNAAGDLLYAGGPDLTPATLARVLIAAGAVRAMELDINPQWVSFSTFAHAGGVAGEGIIAGANLLAGMSYQPEHYLQPFSRDFFAVFAR